jgi:hypothetical protein
LRPRRRVCYRDARQLEKRQDVIIVLSVSERESQDKVSRRLKSVDALSAYRVRLVIGNGAAKAINDGLASLIARAIASRKMFLTGRDDSIDAMASRLGVRRDYLAVLVRLSYLSPEIVRAILAGQQVELTPTRLIALSRNLPHDWQEQRQLLGFAPA